jgi:hypothetical protein
MHMAAKNIPASLERMLFLSQSDNHLRTFMPKKASLMPDLARRLLLEPGVVIPDSYFITSTDMANDLKKTGKSWVWHGLRKGVIVPAFREKEVDSFVENHQRGVKTTHPLGVRDDAHDLNVSLDAAFQGSNTRQLITWPDGMGIAFGKLVNSAFTRESDSISRWSLEDAGLWRKTRDLRAKYVEAAWKLQKDPDTEGLRRASIFRAMAADLGAGDANETPKLIASAPRRDRTALRATILWVDELYNYNHASRMQVRPYFPVGRAAGAHMMPDREVRTLRP